MGERAAGHAQGTLPSGDRQRVEHPQKHRPQVGSGRESASEAHQQSIVDVGIKRLGIYLNGHFRWTSTQVKKRWRKTIYDYGTGKIGDFSAGTDR